MRSGGHLLGFDRNYFLERGPVVLCHYVVKPTKNGRTYFIFFLPENVSIWKRLVCPKIIQGSGNTNTDRMVKNFDK